MAQKLDLGRSTLRIRDSKLQLRLAASANFTQPLNHGAPQIPIDLSHLPNVESVWITEAPELELRFFIGGNWGQNEAAAFISKIRGKLWDMEVCEREYPLNWKLTIPSSRSGQTWDSQSRSRRVQANIALTLLVPTAWNLVCAEDGQYIITKRVGLYPV